MSRRPAATRLFIAVLLLALLAAPVSAAPEQPTIIGGQTAAAGEFPYMVALVQANGGSQFCGGSLIAATWVLTAAHCFFNDQNQQDTFAADVNIVAGTVDLAGGGGQTVGVTRIVEQGYGQNQLLDIALLELAQPVTLGGGVQVVAVNSEGATPATGSNTTITGWGATSPDGNNPSDQLLKVQLPVVACDQDDPTLFVCAGGVQDLDSCQGDSGGPLVVDNGGGNFLQVGVVSTGPTPCAQDGQYGIYTRVSQYSGWINQTIGAITPPIIDADNYVFLPAVSR